jgi:preprotein translocase SecE subunit
MAMSVAENATVATERSPRSAQQQLALGSLMGALYVLVGLWVVLAGIPLVWTVLLQIPEYVNEFLSATLLMMVCGAAAVGIGYLGYQIIITQEQRGLRAGIFFAAIMIFISLWITEAAGNLFEERNFDTTMGLITMGILLVLFLAGTIFLFLQPAWGKMLETVEDQGWFHANPFKASQGIRVRRGTVVGVLTLGICGIVTLINHRSFGYEMQNLPPNNWAWHVPFTGDTAEAVFIPLMFKVHLLMPVLLGILLLAFAWRLVNVPVFADFLIATEAELNKVSWTTRRRLIQDTIVVLTTVLLMTIFLFLVDIMWIKILSSPWVSVLQYNPRQAQQQQQEKNQW